MLYNANKANSSKIVFCTHFISTSNSVVRVFRTMLYKLYVFSVVLTVTIEENDHAATTFGTEESHITIEKIIGNIILAWYLSLAFTDHMAVYVRICVCTSWKFNMFDSTVLFHVLLVLSI